MKKITLGEFLKALYLALGKPLPAGIEDTLDKYDEVLQATLEGDGWVKSDNYHWAWKEILVKRVNGGFMGCLYRDPLRERWVGMLGTFLPWPDGCSLDWKLGYTSATQGRVCTEEKDALYGRHVCILQVDGNVTVLEWNPRLLIGVEPWPPFHQIKVFIDQIGHDRVEADTTKNRTEGDGYRLLKYLESEK